MAFATLTVLRKSHDLPNARAFALLSLLISTTSGAALSLRIRHRSAIGLNFQALSRRTRAPITLRLCSQFAKRTR
jgi:hypothetical protein